MKRRKKKKLLEPWINLRVLTSVCPGLTHFGHGLGVTFRKQTHQ